MIQPCVKFRTADVRYKRNTRNRMLLIFTKSISPVPEMRAMMPSYNAVVAPPRILGPMIANTVAAAVTRRIMVMLTLYLPRYLNSFAMVPLKSRAFSPPIIAIGPPRGLPPIGPRGGSAGFEADLLFCLLLVCSLMPIPPCSTVTEQFPGMPGRFASILYAFLCPRCARYPRR